MDIKKREPSAVRSTLRGRENCPILLNEQQYSPRRYEYNISYKSQMSMYT